MLTDGPGRAGRDGHGGRSGRLDQIMERLDRIEGGLRPSEDQHALEHLRH
jgi:hypothetical protein